MRKKGERGRDRREERGAGERERGRGTEKNNSTNDTKKANSLTISKHVVLIHLSLLRIQNAKLVTVHSLRERESYRKQTSE